MRKALSFVTGRSLAKCDPIVRNRQVLGDALTQASLAGTIGAAAAELMSAFLSLANELVSVDKVIADPDNVRMPEKTAALFMMMFNAIDTIQTQDELAAFMRSLTVYRVPRYRACSLRWLCSLSVSASWLSGTSRSRTGRRTTTSCLSNQEA